MIPFWIRTEFPLTRSSITCSNFSLQVTTRRVTPSVLLTVRMDQDCLTAMNGNFILLSNRWHFGVISLTICSDCGLWRKKIYWASLYHMHCKILDKVIKEFNSRLSRTSQCKRFFLEFKVKSINGLAVMSFIWEIIMSRMHWCSLINIPKVSTCSRNLYPYLLLLNMDGVNKAVFIPSTVPRILSPIVNCLENLERVCEEDEGVRTFVENEFDGVEQLKKDILYDFFKSAFDGSGADNFYDAGSCIDGRLTSAWNWCSQLQDKPFYCIFNLIGFTGFDGEFK